ncbi:ketopantoate hydroxymethyltransferase-domain-containing protein [Kockovaella imperatae]|uniref:3-methyl-2-oxobutanoate hydroxymethyltransferase n=1 Tax=Kockovaella imperatae TaxID=4999 RepID=A0A1Y1UMX3_9TREE|nr:ketopantoate hydroxymethyltransferase-domain-containing protein [Kockovaella imperatae]ORX38824.1 ketopantoate hydroxymethyltransferase-domain-containing protein [Kockovaella imperatae]
MPLPRPARVLRQPSSLSNTGIRRLNRHAGAVLNQATRPFNTTKTFVSTSSESSNSRSFHQTPVASKPELGTVDESYTDKLLKDIDQLGYPRSNSRSAYESDDYEDSREERRSPAAVMGSKRIGAVALPREMERGIQLMLNSADGFKVRNHYREMVSKPYTSHIRRKTRSSIPEDEMPMAKAAAFLPGEYAAVRNVLEEMTRRNVDWDLDPERDPSKEIPSVVEFTGGLGPGLWAALDVMEALPSSSRSSWVLEEDEDESPISSREHVQQRLAKAASEQDAFDEQNSMDQEDLSIANHENVKTLSAPKLRYQMVHDTLQDIQIMKKMLGDRSNVPVDVSWTPRYESTENTSKPTLTMSTFILSTLRPNERDRHYKALLATEAPWIVVVDHATPESWQSISEARDWFRQRSTAESPLTLFAPCPHDGVCPLQGTREICSFSQKLQTPHFLRRTKNHKRGEEQKQYSYLVITRDPMARRSDRSSTSAPAGYFGGVAKDRLRHRAMQLHSNDSGRIIPDEEGSELYKVVSQAEADVDAAGNAVQREWDEPGLPALDRISDLSGDVENRTRHLQADAFHWPRLVAPPIKRSGHVIMDTCDANGELWAMWGYAELVLIGKIQRITIAKSHSKQGYHDARKATWGDLFPHKPKAKAVIRERGIKKLSPVDHAQGEDSGALFEEILSAGMSSEPVGDGPNHFGSPDWVETVSSEAVDVAATPKPKKSNPKSIQSDKELVELLKKRDKDKRRGKPENVLNLADFDPIDNSAFAPTPDAVPRTRKDKPSRMRKEKAIRDQMQGKRPTGIPLDTELLGDLDGIDPALAEAIMRSLSGSQNKANEVYQVQSEGGPVKTEFKSWTEDLHSDGSGDAELPPWLADQDRWNDRTEVSSDSPGPSQRSPRSNESWSVVGAQQRVLSGIPEEERQMLDRVKAQMLEGLRLEMEGNGASSPSSKKPARRSTSPPTGRRKFSSFASSRVGLQPATSFSQKRYMSVRPRETTSVNGARLPRRKVTIAELDRLRSTNTPITVLTAYDYPTALLSESCGVDVTLVGDSLSQVALGHHETHSLTLDEMIHHCRAVTRGAKTPFVIADVPFGAFESSVEKGMESVLRMIKEGGIDGVKIEGGPEIIPLVERLSSYGIPVMPHLGLRPQRATSTSGYLVQGRTVESAKEVFEQALAMERAGATMILLEAIPHPLATYITERLSIPTIGIGAGSGTSGQVLVITDVLGVYAPDSSDLNGSEGGAFPQPKFVRQFGSVGQESRRAIGEYVRHVQDRSFPETGEETYGMKKDAWDAFLASMEGVNETKAIQGDTASGKTRDTEDGA